MQPTRLDLSALRGLVLPTPPKPESTLPDLAASPETIELSRRELLGLAGAAAVTMQPAGKALKAGLLGNFDVKGDDKCVTFSLGGKPRWVIDTRRFAGSPKLSFQRGKHLVRVELKDAVFPGTSLPADFRCEIRPAIVGSRMKLKLALGGFEAEVPFERWLSGGEPARSRVSIDATACDLGNGAGLRLRGKAEAEFLSSWSVQFIGTSIAVVTGLGDDAFADTASVTLLEADAPSLMEQPAKKRALITLDRGTHSWHIERTVQSPPNTRIQWTDNPFDSIRIETAQDGSSRSHRALVAHGNGQTSRFSYCPGGSLKGDDGEEAALPLSGPRYAVAFGTTGQQTALLGDYAEDPVWVHHQAYSVQVGNRPDVEPFELIAVNGEVETVHCEPALLSLSVPLAGAIVEPAVPEGTPTVKFASDDAQVAQVIRKQPTPKTGPTIRRAPVEKTKPATATPVVKPDTATPVLQPKPPADGMVIIGPKIDIARIALDQLVFPVLRPGDLLALAFQFRNLRLDAEAGQAPRLVRSNATKPAYITVHFPPQHIAEQAFLEAAPELPGEPGADQSEALPSPPVQSRVSGPSRLVFRIPDDVTEIPYSLESLLNWAPYEPMLTPTAQPPPVPLKAIGRPGRESLIVVPKTPVRKVGEIIKVQPAQPAQRSGLGGTRRTPRAGAARPSTGAMVATSGLKISRAAAGRAVQIPAKPTEPTNLQTAIEAPYRLIVSPNRTAGWVHAMDEVTHEGRTELWHTRLGVKAGDGKIYDEQYVYDWEDDAFRVVQVSATGNKHDHYRTLRAIWSPDYRENLPSHNDLPFRMSLDRRDRCELVWLTSDFRIPDCRERVVRAQRFMLSSLGVWMNVRYADLIPTGTGLSVEEWRHKAIMGRDQKVRVVYAGFLYPFGHPASLVKVTERKFERKGSIYVAYLRQRFFIVVRDPVQTYPAMGQPNGARQLPFDKITVTTLVTPSLDPIKGVLPKQINDGGQTVAISDQAAFWPKVRGKDFLFHFEADDSDGHRPGFTAPAMFVGVENQVSYRHRTATLLRSHYNAAANEGRRDRDFAGQKVALAESSPDKPGDTTLETRSIRFEAVLPASRYTTLQFDEARLLRAYPALQQAKVRIDAVAQMMGEAEESLIRIASRYVSDGWDAARNKGQVFAELIEKTGLQFPGDKSGGLVSPDMMISGLSRRFGPIAGQVNKMADGLFDPEDFFGDIEAKILGGINLAKIIMGLFGDGKVPELSVRPIYPDNNTLALPEAIEAKLHWEPGVKKFTPFEPRSGCKLTLDGLLRKELTGGMQSTFEMKTVLTKFDVNLSVLIVKFDKFQFLVKNGNKPDVDVDIQNVEFGGPLEFVNKLRDYMKSGALGGMSLDITGKGVTAGFALAIPDVAVGIMSLENMKLSAAITLPFTGDPVKLRFAFCSRENPFLLTVSLFGGGGFFGVELSSSGLELMEASFEFGGNFAMNIGVASGGAYVMAGIYFKLAKNDQGGSDVELTGYLRCGGHLEILKIITISCEFYLSLTYESTGGRSRVWGQASLKVKIKILFFSIGVTLKVEREFAGSASGSAHSLDGARIAGLLDGPEALAQLRRRPVRRTARGVVPAGDDDETLTVQDVITAGDWRAYCDAFA